MHASSAAKLLGTTSASSSASASTSKSATSSASASASSSTTSVDPKSEIEEISKKISEHADAIYRTWKCRGLAPTELFDFYTSAAATTEAAAAMATTATDFLSTATDETTSTEGLQKLVNAFVIKDKEQHKRSTVASGRKSATVTPAIGTGTTRTATATAAAAVKTNKNDKSNAELFAKSSNLAKQAKPATQRRPSAILLPDVADALPAGEAKKSPTIAMTSTAAKSAKIEIAAAADKSSHLESTTSNGGVDGGGVAIRTRKYAKPAEKSAAAAKDLKNLELGLNLNLDLGLNLDVQNLTQLQTENLLKIKELLQQESKTAAAVATPKTKKTTTTPTKIATPVASKVVNQQQSLNKQPTSKASLNTSSSNNAYESAVATTATTTANKIKRTTIKTATSTPTLTMPSSDNRKVGNNIASNHNADVVVVAADTSDKNSSANAVTNKSTTNAAAALVNTKSNQEKQQQQQPQQQQQQQIVAVSSNSNFNSNTNTSAIQQIKGLKTKSDEKIVKTNKVIKSANNIGSSSSDNIDVLNKTLIDNTIFNEKTAQQINANDLGQQQQEQQKIVAVTTTTTPTTPISTSPKTNVKAAATNVTAATATATSPPATISSATLLVATTATMEIARNTMPSSPTKIKTARPLTNGQDKNLGRPILTRGSVAERVLMFEKCPDVRTAFHNIKRPETAADVPPKIKVKLHATPPTQAEQTSLQRELRAAKSVYIPRFYFPHGKPQPQIAIERTLRGILSAFDSFPNNQVTKDELPRILKLCGLPFYWRMPVMVFCQQSSSGLVERQRFVEFWKQMNVYCHDNASRFVYILSRGQRFRTYILPEDLAPLVQDVVDTHPGLAFLKEATEFHSRYVHTVIARIFYSVNRSWSGKISISELKKSDLLEIISLLEEEDDINQIMAFFSYEHFYVIYCKFWELDRDHDLLINQEDLARHSDHALSTRIVERIFSGCVTRSDHRKDNDDEPKMSYTDFVWFLLSEEDKRTPTAIEYWFRCMDVDGDGVLSMYELEYFYEEQQQRMESIGIETLPFEDCLCQMLDMIKPQQRDYVTLGDLKRCKMTHVFFDTFFNLEKYLDHEQRDPFASQRDEYASDWDRFAAQEYELLITEEND